eukprot:7965429-Pyramimonas_sp.AAC.1
MIKGIYSQRYFAVVDHCGRSTQRPQRAGIAQGFPLPPYLFIAVQTVLLHDALAHLPLAAEPDYVVARDIFFADDTVFASSDPGNLQQMLDATALEGQKYGLELNWDKTVQV